MALDFLLNLLKTIPSIRYNQRGGAVPYLPQQEALAAKQAGIGDALMDPNNPLYKQQYQQSMDRNNASLAQTIAEAQRQNRKETQLGRTPLFDPERGGETLFRSLMHGQQGLSATADNEARASLGQAGQAYGSGLAGYNNLTPYGAMSGYQKDVMPYEGIAALLSGVKNKSSSSFSSYVPGGNGLANSGQTQGLRDIPISWG